MGAFPSFIKGTLQVIIYSLIGAFGFIGILLLLVGAEYLLKGLGFALIAIFVIGIYSYVAFKQRKEIGETIKAFIELAGLILRFIGGIMLFILFIAGILFGLRAFVHFLIY